VINGSVTAPDSILAGWTRMRVEEDGGGHIVVAFRLPDGAINGDVADFLAALDTARRTPDPAVAMGGPEIGEVGEVVLNLSPGRYVLGCVRRADDGRRHASRGEAKVIVVTGPVPASRATPPTPTVEIGLADFAFVGRERWPAGPHLLRVTNRGEQEHQLRLVRLEAGVTLRAWLEGGGADTSATPIAGMARLGPGGVAYLPLDLQPGEYVVYCLIPDVGTGRAHVELGMFRSIRVE
jgi:hypothetical protein